MKVYGIGLGPGDAELITLKSFNILNKVKRVYVPTSKGKSIAKTMLEQLEVKTELVELEITMGKNHDETYKKIAKEIKSFTSKEGDVAYVTIGDPMVYSTYMYIMHELQKLGIEVETIPGITAFQASANRINLTLTEKAETMVMCDHSINEDLLKHTDSICIFKVNKFKEDILDILEKNNFEYWYFKRISHKDEVILRDKQEILQDHDYMSLIIGKRMKGEN